MQEKSVLQSERHSQQIEMNCDSTLRKFEDLNCWISYPVLIELQEEEREKEIKRGQDVGNVIN